jgi:hypothetical protein
MSEDTEEALRASNSIGSDAIERFIKAADVVKHKEWRVTDLAFQELRACTLSRFHQSPCFWQMKISMCLLTGQKDIVCISGTGSGKSLTFWMPLLVRPKGIQIVITALNLLGSQMVQKLLGLGIQAVNVNADTANAQVYKVFITFSMFQS